MAITDFKRKKKIDVSSVSGTPTISRTMCLKIAGNDDSVTGTGEIVLDWTNISSKADIGVYDENNNLLDYYFETFDVTAETAVIWVYRDWVQDGSTQLQVAYGDGPSDQSVDASNVFSKETDLAAGYLFNETSGDLIDVSGNGNHGTVYGATQGEDGIVGGAYSLDGSDDYIDSTYIPSGKQGTISILLNPNNAAGSANEHFTSVYDGDDQIKIQNYNDGNTYIGLRVDGTFYRVVTSDPFPSGYFLLTLTWDIDENYLEVWWNDVSKGTKSPSGSFNISKPIIIGAINEGGIQNHAAIDVAYVALLSKITSLSEQKALCDATKSSPDFFSQQAGEDIVVDTNAATNVTSISATLNGTLNDLQGGSSLDVWFDYSTNDSFSSYDSTSTQTLSATGSFSDDVSGLTFAETYYVRAAATDGVDTWYGETESFIAADFEYVEDEGSDFETGALDDITISNDELLLEQGLYVDGDGDYVSLSPDDINYSNEEATLAIKIKLDNATPADKEQTGFCLFGTASYSSHYPYTNGDGYFSEFRSSRIDGVTLSTSVDRADWHWVIITTKPGTDGWNLYQNKELVHTDDGETTIPKPSSYALGKSYTRDYTPYMQGTIAEARLYTRALSSAEVEDLVDGVNVDDTGLTVWYTFNELDSGSVPDLSGSNNTGFLNGDPEQVSISSTGTRTTPSIDISTLSAVEDSVVQWTSTEPADTSITIEAAISEDGGSTWGSWQTCTDGSAVPGLADADLSDARIRFKQTLETTDETETPKLEKFEFYIAEGDDGATVSGAVSDGVNLLDTKTRIASYLSNLTDSLVLSTDKSSIGLFMTSVADITLFSESSLSVATLRALLSDNVVLSEARSAAIIQLVSAMVEDGITVNDAPLVYALFQALASDEVILTDSSQTLAQFVTTISDKLLNSDSVLSLAHFVSAVSDQTVFTDSTIGSLLKFLSASLSDGLNLSDLRSVIATYETLLSDVGQLSDYGQHSVIYAAQLLSGTRFSDEALGLLDGLISAALSDGIRLSELSSKIAEFQTQIEDDIICSDSNEKLTQFVASLLDGVIHNDESKYFLGIIDALLSDTLKMYDHSLGNFLFEQILTDGVVTSDSLTRERILHALLSDRTLLDDKYFVGRLTVLLVKLISSGPNIKITGRSD